jgi:hypothetical protein
MISLICIISLFPIAIAGRTRSSSLATIATRRHKRRAIHRSSSLGGSPICGFGSPLYFTDNYIPSNAPGVSLKLPNYEALFDEICKVSPLAKQALTLGAPGGIRDIDANAPEVYQWKVVEDNPSKKLVSRIDKIDNFQGKGVPLLRFRSTLHGPAKQRGVCFSELISVASLRRQWDPTSDLVDTVYTADCDEVDEYNGHKYGKTSLFGVGYVKTKQSVVSPREQLTLCGLQTFPSGASILWGIELEESQNHLFPKEQTRRKQRSTSHLFSTTIVPTGLDSFDVEYVLQIEIGGFPGWLTGPIAIETVKGMFRFADGYFRGGLEGEGGDLGRRLALFPPDDHDETPATADSPYFFATRHHDESVDELSETTVLEQEQTLLMTP